MEQGHGLSVEVSSDVVKQQTISVRHQIHTSPAAPGDVGLPTYLAELEMMASGQKTDQRQEEIQCYDLANPAHVYPLKYAVDPYLDLEALVPLIKGVGKAVVGSGYEYGRDACSWALRLLCR